MGFAASAALISLGVILAVHHRIPPAIVPEVIGAGVALIALGLAGLVVSVRLWQRWGGPISIGSRHPEDDPSLRPDSF